MIDALVASGLSVDKFARREGIDAERVYRWKRKLGVTPSTTPTFVEIRQTEVISKGRQIEIALRSGHRMFFGESIDPSVLCRLLQVLE